MTPIIRLKKVLRQGPPVVVAEVTAVAEVAVVLAAVPALLPPQLIPHPSVINSEYYGISECCPFFLPVVFSGGFC